MKLSSLNWMHVEQYLKTDDRCVFPVGSTEQHAYLSLATDSILAEKIAIEAAEPLNIPVLPVLNYGYTPSFMDYPGTISLSSETLWLILKEVLESLIQHGFKKILIVNGHGGNSYLADNTGKWMMNQKGVKVKFHNWWNSQETIAKVKETDPAASHASWMENFEWTRLKNVIQPEYQKPMINAELLKGLSPKEIRKNLGDGNYGGFYQRNDDEMKMIWNTAVIETRKLLTDDWN
jgi:creatinine amidohydrolase